MEIDYTAIGRRIRDCRRAKHLTQLKLGELAEIEASNISHIERGATKLSFPTLVRIANVLEVSLDELVYDNLSANSHVSCRALADLIQDCTGEELQASVEIVRTTKSILRKNGRK